MDQLLYEIIRYKTLISISSSALYNYAYLFLYAVYIFDNFRSVPELPFGGEVTSFLGGIDEMLN